MILRPVSPVSPWGPPTTNRPVGLMKNFAFFDRSPFGMTFRTTSAMIPSVRSFRLTSSECCEEQTTAVISRGTQSS